MKKFKKMMAIVLSLAVVLAFSVPTMVFAEDGHTISVNSADTHTYYVYQVLTGTLAKAGDQKLGNPAWGADAIAEPGDVDEFIDSITADGISKQDIAQLVAAKVNTNGNGRGMVDKDHPITGLATGYYVLVDKTDLSEKPLETSALHVVQVVNDINGIQIKWGTTEQDKEIVSDTLGDKTNEIGGDVDNVSIGDTVNFKIEATIPDNANLYNYFYYVINDTLDPGLTLNDDSITVYKESIVDANKLTEETDYLVKTGDDASPKSFQVGLVNAKDLAGKKIIVTYSAVLNENATIGEVPNKNTSTVTFSNDPNHNYDGTNNPGFPAEKDLEATGETPKSVTETYTTGIEIQKVDDEGNILTGAAFTITGDSTEIVLVSSEVFAEDPAGDYYKLNNDTYTKEAPVTADYMEEAAAGETKGYVVAEAGYEGDDTVTVGGTAYRPVKEGDTGTVYILVKANADQYASTETKYKKTVTYTQKNTNTSGVTATAEVGPDGVVVFKGLGAGEYTISETTTPAGYNTMPDLTVTVTFTKDGTPKWSFSGGNGTYDQTDGLYKLTIENNKGQELPSTGGIGTTIFYVLGALLVVGAGVLLVTRRRMKTN